MTEVVREELNRQRRPNDGLLHASSHITGSLRHAQLDVAGAPRVESELISELRMMTGTFWHRWLADTLRNLGVPVMAEVNVTPWLPDGWGGTADLVIWNPELKAFVLADLKTTKGEGMRYIERDGAKAEHVAQTSAYWYALKKMGIPLAKVIGVYYLPMNDTRNKDEAIEPALVDFDPLPAKALQLAMAERHKRTAEYVQSLPRMTNAAMNPPETWVTDALEPVQQRQQRLYLDRKTDTWELKLVPHWSAQFCPFPDELCDCSSQGTTKIGMYDIDGAYYPRPGFEEIEPEVAPE